MTPTPEPPATGGEPLDVPPLLARLRALGVELSLRGDRLAWSAPPGAMTPALLGELRAAKPALLAELRGGWMPLAAVQERLWAAERLRPGRPDFNVPAGLRVRGPLDTAALGRALDALAARHDALRLAFAADRPAQRVVAHASVPLEVREVADERAALAAATEEARRPFDLATGPQLRALVLRLAPGDHLLVVSFHHLTCDEHSLRLALGELVRLYVEHAGGPPAALAPPARQYGDYVAAERREEDVEYWRRRLEALPPNAPHGDTIHTASFHVIPTLLELARAERVTPVAALATAAALALGEPLQRADVLLGMPFDDRPEGFAGTVGTFVNTFVLRSNPAAAPTLRAALQHVGAALLDALPHARVRYDRIVTAAARTGELFDAWLVVRRAANPLPLAGATRVELEPAVARHILKLDLVSGPDGIEGLLVGRWEHAKLERLSATFAALLTHAADLADAPLATFLATAEQDASDRLRAQRTGTEQAARERLRTTRRVPA